MMPRPPIFVVDRDGGDMLAFDDVRLAEGFMEPPEVEDDAYEVFDSAGHVGALTIREFDVLIESWSASPDLGRFRRVLEAFLGGDQRAIGDEVDLDVLVSSAYQRAQEEELARTHPRFLVPFLKWFRRRRRADGNGA